MSNVLVVDDDVEILDLIETRLSIEGLQVFKACTEWQAFQLLAKHRIDVISLDIRMPDTDGVSMLRMIKDQYPKIPVILFSAYPEYKQDFGTWACDAYLMKTGDLDEFVGEVKKQLSAADAKIPES